MTSDCAPQIALGTRHGLLFLTCLSIPISLQEREAREKARKEKLQRDLQDARDDGEDHHASDAGKEGGNDQVAEVRPSKKKKKRALAAALSFDVDGEDS